MTRNLASDPKSSLVVGREGSGAVFVPSANPGSEDDGDLKTYVYYDSTNESSFVIMDAAMMDNTPMALIELPRIPNGFSRVLDSSDRREQKPYEQ